MSFFSAENFVSHEFIAALDTVVLGLPYWKWISLIAVLFFLFFFRRVVLWIIIKIKKAQKAFRENTFMSFFLRQEVEKGLSWILISLTGMAMIDSLELTAKIDLYLTLVLKVFLWVNLIRTCYMAAEALGLALQEWSKTTENDLDDHLAPFATKTFKVLVIVVGFLMMLQNFGINVTALLAGLGIGGVALAFAAQDTVANVFGTITILLDRPFKLGDWVKIGDTEGNVEELGFRSTRIRTFYNSLITIPNSVVAKERIDNYSARRGLIRFRHTLGFTYDATPAQLHEFCENLRYHLLQDPTIDRNRILAHFNSYGDFSLNVLVNFHYTLQDGEVDASRINSYLNLIFETAQKTGLSFAFPTQTLIMQK